MKLYYGPASPYVRKVMVAAFETNLDSRLHLERFGILAATTPNERITAVNPLAKIPTLVPEEGPPMFDSRVICEYLDSLHNGPKLFPAVGKERWLALTRSAAADGLLDAAMAARAEMARPAALQLAEWAEAQLGKSTRCLDWFERDFGAPGAHAGLSGSKPIDIGHIACGCALGWLDFRMPNLNWREGRPALAAWFGELSQRRSMKMTAPANPPS